MVEQVFLPLYPKTPKEKEYLDGIIIAPMEDWANLRIAAKVEGRTIELLSPEQVKMFYALKQTELCFNQKCLGRSFDCRGALEFNYFSFCSYNSGKYESIGSLEDSADAFTARVFDQASKMWPVVERIFIPGLIASVTVKLLSQK